MNYWAEKWSTIKQLEQKLITAQRAMERRMLNITIRDKARNTEIRKHTQVKDIMVKISEAKGLSFFFSRKSGSQIYWGVITFRKEK